MIGSPTSTIIVVLGSPDGSHTTGTLTINFTNGRPPVLANFVVAVNGDEIDTVVISASGSQGILTTGSIGKRRFSKH
jgi:hypothetical protein